MVMDKYVNFFSVGDNLEVLKNIHDNVIDLIYIDPPFNTNRNFDDFNDRWEDEIYFCNDFMAPRLREAYRVLNNTGNLVLHVDIKSVHRLKILLDSIFGISNFRNEIIWVTGGNSKTTYKLYKSHDNLLVYSKSKKAKFNPQYRPYDEEYYKKNNVKFCNHYKKPYITCAIYNSQPNVIKRPNLRYEWNGHYKQWHVSKERLQFLHNTNRLEYNKKGLPRIKRFLDEMSGVPLRDVWTDINSIQAPEKLDYATQKPVKLLERVIKLYTDEEDIVMDFFAGSGTTGRACINLNRQYILVDSNEKAKKIFEESVYSRLNI